MKDLSNSRNVFLSKKFSLIMACVTCVALLAISYIWQLRISLASKVSLGFFK